MKTTILCLIAISSALLGKECPFCEEKILQAQTFYESEHIYGLLTYKPAVPGHVLVIPKRHVERFEELTDQELIEAKEAFRLIHLAVKNLYGPNDYLLLQKNGEAAGRSVSHLHFHYLPRSEKMCHFSFAIRFFLADLSAPLPPEQLKETAQLLANEIDRILK